MKQVRRPNVQLPTLLPTGRGGREAARREGLFNQRSILTDVNTDFPEFWGNADVRGALIAMHGQSCAYCDREIPDERGAVEHFRPKSKYWWLAYSFENYLLACPTCNSYKSEAFPVLGRFQRNYDYSRKAQLNKERRAFVDPVVDLIDGWLGIDLINDWENKGFPIAIKSGISRMLRKRCETTIEKLNLNIDSKLLKRRIETLHVALDRIEMADAGHEGSKTFLRQTAVRFSPDSFTVRQAIMLKNRPEYLPAPEEELDWLICNLVQMITLADNALRTKKSNSERQRRNRCAWALAVLMRDPPALSTEEIRTRLNEKGVLGIVERYYRRLPV